MKLMAPKGKYRPWMSAREIRLIEDILTRARPWRCLEWGAGYSTLYFPAFLAPGATWTSVEHNSEWAARIKELVRGDNVTVCHVAPNRFPWSDTNQDGDEIDLKDYIEFPGRDGKYYFILIDGRARAACLARAADLLADGGVVALHDANRTFYTGPFIRYRYQELFRDYGRTEGGLWLGSRDSPIEAFLDLKKYRRLWHLTNSIRRIRGTAVAMMRAIIDHRGTRP